ncbi:hypothetical protein Bpfe_031120 [Biomphalaria pfeifferi]|uniref:Uncharacterized protein n=1 Tax=Biomphalaria pfeifferi TaxID=112525 RepID=A0AAD8API8_BIOPF|nr:hypothetical protein Bpfe_031120 [Biomphalaria pfeifferi]
MTRFKRNDGRQSAYQWLSLTLPNHIRAHLRAQISEWEKEAESDKTKLFRLRYARCHLGDFGANATRSSILHLVIGLGNWTLIRHYSEWRKDIQYLQGLEAIERNTVKIRKLKMQNRRLGDLIKDMHVPEEL